ncbi:MAG TPA: DSD1 family PLP-dependent enzyme [Usitatibacteraceae bacterium]
MRHDQEWLLGRGVDEIDTPALVIDLDAMERNLECMAVFARQHGVRLRPHAKMHKSAALANMQIAAGAVGVCAQKTAEAECLAAGGVNNIFISNEVIAPAKLQRVAALARQLAARGGRLAIAVDSEIGIARLAAACAGNEAIIDVFVEIDVGQRRCGVAPGAPALALVRKLAMHPSLRFAGLQAYHGSAQHFRTAAERRAAISRVTREVADTVALIEGAGFAAGLVTGAGTGTFALEAASGIYGELQAGSYLFMDADYARNEPDPAQPRFEHALFVKTQVMSVSDTHVVCDAGHKSHAVDSGMPLVWNFGAPQGQAHGQGQGQGKGQGLEVTGCSDESGVIRTMADGGALPALGDILWLVPGHCDPTVNLHDVMIGVRGGLHDGVVERIFRVDARGALA